MIKNLIPYFLITIGDVMMITIAYIDGINNSTIAGMTWMIMLTIGAAIVTILIRRRQENPTP